MTEEFRELLRSKSISEEAIDALIANRLDTAEALHECDDADLLLAGLKVLGDRKKVFAIIRYGAKLSLSDNTAENKQPTNFDSAVFLKQLGSGLNLGSMKPRINVQFAKIAADAVLAYAIVLTGILDVFDSAFWKTIVLEDIELRASIYHWKEMACTERYISNAAKNDLISSVTKLFPESLDTLILNARKMSTLLEASEMMGAQARINIASDATGIIALRDLIPLAAEALSNSMIGSEMPEQALSIISMVNELVSLLKHPSLLTNAGVTNYQSAEEGAYMFLKKRFGQEIANKFRLAFAYEQCVRAIAACPAPEVIDKNYLQIVGMLAGRLCTYYALVQPGNADDIRPFSNLKNLGRKAAEPISQKKTAAKIAVAPATGWPFPKFNSNAKGRIGTHLPMVVGPKVNDLTRCVVPLAIIGTGDFISCTITNLIWFGDGKGEGNLNGCTVTKFYCVYSDEPEITGGTVPMPDFKTRDELIVIAVELAQQRNVQLL